MVDERKPEKPESKAVKTRKEFEKVQAEIEAERKRRQQERRDKTKK